ncbi:MAG TPA: short chain dehydrogenase [Kofleriaceae bacterium]|nr:short chain dehydrogenase [Kofleriaceae bacterium]
MKIVVIGATGVIGSAVADALASRHEVVRASRTSATRVDVEDPASLERLFAEVHAIDAVVSCATGTPARWQRMFGPIEQLDDEHMQILFGALRSQLDLVRLCRTHVRDGGSITLTTGTLARHPLPGTAAVTMMAAGLEGLVPAAALDMPRGTRINAVSPGWVKETMDKMGLDSSPGMPAATLAGYYLEAVEGTINGAVIDPTA